MTGIAIIEKQYDIPDFWVYKNDIPGELSLGMSFQLVEKVIADILSCHSEPLAKNLTVLSLQVIRHFSGIMIRKTVTLRSFGKPQDDNC